MRNTWIICPESNRSPPSFRNSKCIDFRRVNQIVHLRIGLVVEVSEADPNNIKAISMHVHWMIF